VIAVELDEDPSLRVVGNLVASAGGALNEVDPHTIVIGEPLCVVFAKVEEVYLRRCASLRARPGPPAGPRRAARLDTAHWI
jgi:hypothetical protein